MTDPSNGTLALGEGGELLDACQKRPNPVSVENPTWRKVRGVVVALLLVAPPAIYAQANIGVTDCAGLPEPGAAISAAQAHFESLGPHCLRDAEYFRNRGQWLLQHNNPSAAIEALERALLLEPDHLGTQLDYSQALLAVGDNESAQSILHALRALPDVPPHLLPLMDGQLLALQPQLPADAGSGNGMTSRTVLSQSFGVDSNLNNATTATNIILTYPDVDLELPLAEAYRPQSGVAATTALQWTGVVPHNQQIWLLQAEARSRHTANPATRNQQVELHATWLQNPTAIAQWIGRVEHTELRWGGRKLYNSERVGVQHQWVHTLGTVGCRTAAGLEVENRDYPGSRMLDGEYRGAVFTLVCQKQSSFNLQVRTGQDQPSQAGRVGGSQRHSEARVQWQHRNNGNQWQLEYTLQHQQDATGYSPLLLRNAPRRVTRQAVRLETSYQLNWPAMGDPQWFGSVELTRQASNLQAFVSSRKAIQTGLRWAWP